MESSVSVNYTELNEAAKIVFDEAMRRGVAAGRNEAAHEAVEHIGRRMLELAGWQLDIAISIEQPELRWRAANLARNLYGRTPGGTGFAGGRLPGMFDAVLKPRTDIDADAARELIPLLAAIGKGEQS